jgi:hypothetical protein
MRGALRIEGGAERGQVQVAVDAAELLAGLDPADGAPGQCHGAVCQFFTSLEWVRAMEIIDSTQSVLRSVPLIVLLHNGPLSWVDLAVAQHLPQGRCQGDRHLNFHESRDKSIALTRKAPAYGVGQGFQRTGPARSGGSSTGPVHDTKTGSASAMVGDGRVGDSCVVYRWS